jgi:hypothetical protein
LETDSNDEPNHLGFNIGFECADPFNLTNIFWITEYSAVSRYTYCHFTPYQRYHYRNTPIGSPYGPDYDEIHTKIIYHASPRIDLYSQISYLRKGESSIETVWPIPEDPRVEGTSFPENNFLSGTVQRSAELGFGLRFFHRHSVVADLFFGYSHCNNFQHKVNEPQKLPFLRISIELINLRNF